MARPCLKKNLKAEEWEASETTSDHAYADHGDHVWREGVAETQHFSSGRRSSFQVEPQKVFIPPASQKPGPVLQDHLTARNMKQVGLPWVGERHTSTCRTKPSKATHARNFYIRKAEAGGWLKV